jgi:hypothetical protein
MSQLPWWVYSIDYLVFYSLGFGAGYMVWGHKGADEQATDSAEKDTVK